MKVELTFIVDKVGKNKLYSGEVYCPESGNLKPVTFRTLILAQNSADAMSKLKAYIAKENPSIKIELCRITINLEYVIA